MERRKKASRSPEGSVQLSTAPSIALISMGKEEASGEEIAALNAGLKENSEKLAKLRERNRELMASLQEKRGKVAELDAVHEQRQTQILQYERQLATQRRFPYMHDLKIRKSDLISAEKTHFTAIKTLIQQYIEKIEGIDWKFSPISHDIRIVELMDTQITLYRNQIQQNETQFLQLLAHFSKSEEELEAEICDLRTKISTKQRKSTESGENREEMGQI